MPEPKIEPGSVILHAKLTGVTVCVLPESNVNHHLYAVKVEYRGDERYAVVHCGYVLGTDGEWEYEPRPSGRPEPWLATHRYDYDTAYRLACEWAPKVDVNGRTAAEVADLAGVAVKP